MTLLKYFPSVRKTSSLRFRHAMHNKMITYYETCSSMDKHLTRSLKYRTQLDLVINGIKPAAPEYQPYTALQTTE